MCNSFKLSLAWSCVTVWWRGGCTWVWHLVGNVWHRRASDTRCHSAAPWGCWGEQVVHSVTLLQPHGRDGESKRLAPVERSQLHHSCQSRVELQISREWSSRLSPSCSTARCIFYMDCKCFDRQTQCHGHFSSLSNSTISVTSFLELSFSRP